MNKINRKGFLILIVTLLLLPIVSNSNTVTITNNKISLELTITDAYYIDLDDDELEDDIVGIYEINVTTSKFDSFKVDFEYELVLPSGYTFYHQYSTEIEDQMIRFTVNMYDHAIESGWYDFIVFGTIYQGGKTSGNINLVFDPPDGGAGGNIPSIYVDETVLT